MSLSLLNLGCGSFVHEDWTNVDFVSYDKRVLAHNLLLGIPFKGNSFDAVYHSHVLEHFPKNQALPFLKECYRVLKPGGWLRVVVPDLEKLCREYLKWLELVYHGDENAKQNYEWIVIEMLDQLVRNQSGGEMAKYLSNPNNINYSYVEKRIGSDVTDGLLAAKIHMLSRSQMLNNKLMAFFRWLFGKHADYYFIGKFKMSGENHQWMYDRSSLSKLLSEAGFEIFQIKSAFDSNIKSYEKYLFDTYKGKARGESSIIIEAKKTNLVPIECDP